MKVGILEFRDNEFMRSVAAGLTGVETELVRVGQLAHPSPSRYGVIVDRVSFCDPFLRQVMRYWSLGGAYVLNNPFYTLVFDKLAELLCHDKLAIAHPRTLLLPRANAREDMREMVSEPDWKAVEESIGFPCILKPVDGYAWQDVFKVSDPEMLRALYESLKESRTLLVQELVRYTSYYRAFCVNRSDVFIVQWSPQPYDRGVYATPDEAALGPVRGAIVEKTAALNRALGLDFNTVEWCVRDDGTPVLIDSYNDVPDVRPEKLPPACYQWIVGRFCACVKDKLASGARNELGEMFQGSEAGALPR